eukprot:scaffold2621_cov344-Prasinococcus_capsulatus_cf.AAC.3
MLCGSIVERRFSLYASHLRAVATRASRCLPARSQPSFRRCKASGLPPYNWASSSNPVDAHGARPKPHPADREFLQFFRNAGGTGLRDPYDSATGGVAELFSSEKGRGLRACCPIEGGQTVLCVPLGLTLSDRKSPFPGATWHCRVAAQLFTESMERDSSTLAPYLRMLPDSAAGLAAMQPEDVQALLRSYEPLHSVYRQHTHEMTHQTERYAEGFAAEDQGKLGTWTPEHEALFEWALSMACSRAFTVLVQLSEVHLIVPGADFCNHSHAPNLSYLSDKHTETFKLIATRAIERGEELTICYDEEASNDSFLLHYGFIPEEPDNPNDTSLLWPRLSDASLGILNYAHLMGHCPAEAIPTLQTLQELIRDEWDLADEPVLVSVDGAVDEDVAEVLRLVLGRYSERERSSGVVEAAVQERCQAVLDRLISGTIGDELGPLERYREGKARCLRTYLERQA